MELLVNATWAGLNNRKITFLVSLLCFIRTYHHLHIHWVWEWRWWPSWVWRSVSSTGSKEDQMTRGWRRQMLRPQSRQLLQLVYCHLKINGKVETLVILYFNGSLKYYFHISGFHSFFIFSRFSPSISVSVCLILGPHGKFPTKRSSISKH